MAGGLGLVWGDERVRRHGDKTRIARTQKKRGQLDCHRRLSRQRCCPHSQPGVFPVADAGYSSASGSAHRVQRRRGDNGGTRLAAQAAFCPRFHGARVSGHLASELVVCH